MSTVQGGEKKSPKDVKSSSTRENGTAAAIKQYNKAVTRKAQYSSANCPESDDNRTTSPSGPSEAEHSTDTDGAEADDENDENEPRKGM